MLAMEQLYPERQAAARTCCRSSAPASTAPRSRRCWRKPADVTHSSLWGGDLQAFILQAGAARPVQAHASWCSRPPTTCCRAWATRCPTASILGARGAYGLMSPKTPLNDWWWDLYAKAYNVYPVQAPYRMAQSLLGLKLAVEKAMAANGGKKPTPEQLAAALNGLEWDSPGRPDPHGARQRPPGDPGHRDRPHHVRRRRRRWWCSTTSSASTADCVNPPADMKSEEWIKAGFPGAKCCDS